MDASFFIAAGGYNGAGLISHRLKTILAIGSICHWQLATSKAFSKAQFFFLSGGFQAWKYGTKANTNLPGMIREERG